jgi:hypothetical protein
MTSASDRRSRGQHGHCRRAFDFTGRARAHCGWMSGLLSSLVLLLVNALALVSVALL